MTADEVNALMSRAFPGTDSETQWRVTTVAPGRCTTVRPYADVMLRPGGLVSGPNLMAMADTAAYALILAHIGEQLMAVTSQLTINFLRGAKPGDIHAEAELLHLGRRSAVCDVRLWTESPDRLAAQASVAYALPLPEART
ncbi:PaaI family thioesterase [Phenylobacterium sp. J367]|uniref:PaaI family thioesterase n=1 Tax=Phenylobacterium sp. J367 TaxID=2898435 RepID=UPI002151A10C|nr:PaaI family thioesterase [Phenylobacterium sp. J367]MCR5881010.1 PaaI family thioesterase [Phenylobacterium sp. J367]